MSVELFFIYDSHCPWSYATTRLVNEIAKAKPEIHINFWHSAYFQGDHVINDRQLAAVNKESSVTFAKAYTAKSEQEKDSTLAANLLTWANQKSHKNTLPLLNAIQEQHFQHGNDITSADDVEAICQQLKLSPPQKSLTLEKLTKSTEAAIHDVFELQDIIGTQAIPALLLAIDDNLILLNHNLYLSKPKAIVDAINLELQ